MDRKCLIINYLPQSMDEKKLYKMFRQIGPIHSCRLMYDKATGYSYGYGFVEYEDEIHASQAIEELNGYYVEGKTLKVAYSRPRSEQTRGTNIYVSNLPRKITDKSLREMFQRFGEVVQSRLINDLRTGMPKGIAFVIMALRSNAEAAIKELNGTIMDGGHTPLLVKFADEEGKRKKIPLKYMQQQSNMIGHIRKIINPLVQQEGHSIRFNPYGRLCGNSDGPDEPTNLSTIMDKMINSIDPVTGGYIIYVYGIGSSPDEHEIREMFEHFGQVHRIDIIRNLGTNDCKGYCFVVMSDYDTAQIAIDKLNGTEFNGRKIQVRFKV
ncbi:hypothetical protein ACOME3_008649 [Neoechinorhynchus agilis]